MTQTGKRLPRKSENASMSDEIIAGLTRDLEAAEQAQAMRFAQIVRHVKRERSKPPADFGASIRRDMRLATLLVEFENESELVGMIDVVRDIRIRADRDRQRDLRR